MADPVFPLAEFRILYPEFASVNDATVNAVAKQALCYVSEAMCACGAQAWQLMVAHLLALRNAISTSGATGALASATIDKVSVSFVAPPSSSSEYRHWLHGTPYGQQLLALLTRCTAGGEYIGGLPERRGFRKVYGTYR